MGLIGRSDPDFDECAKVKRSAFNVKCECCTIREEMEATEMLQDDLARLSLRLRLKAEGLDPHKPPGTGDRYPGEHDAIVGTQGNKFIMMRTSEWLESGEFQENLEYIGDGKPTEGQKIAAQHPECHFLVLFEGGTLATFTTEYKDFDFEFIITDEERRASLMREVQEPEDVWELCDTIRLLGADMIWYAHL